MSLGIHSEVDEQRSEVDLLWEITLDETTAGWYPAGKIFPQLMDDCC